MIRFGYLSFVSVVSMLLFMGSCSSELPKINYGKDTCALCKMTIMDKKFGAVLVNAKGKQLKFDSGECMAGYLKADKDFNPQQILVADYAHPETLTDATTAHFLHGGTINSPMGGQLAAFKNRADAEKLQAEFSANLIHWSSVTGIIF